MLNLWRLSLLRDLSNLGTMAAVAKAAQLSRPAVSQHLALLEHEAGMALLERTPRGVILTDDGKRLADHARELLAHVEAVESDMASVRENVVGTVRFAAFGSFAGAIASRAIASLRGRHPHLEPIFIELEPQDSITALLRRSIDLAVVDDMVSVQDAKRSLEFSDLMEDQFLAALPSDHPLTERRVVELGQLRDERWVVNESASAYHQFVLRACREAGFEPEVLCSSRSGSTALSFVSNSALVSVLPQLSAVEAPTGVVFRPLEPSLARRIRLAVNRGTRSRPTVRAVADALAESVAATLGGVGASA